MVHNCQMCGAPFPEGTPPARRFCYECLAIRHDKQRRESAERRRLRQKAEPEKPPEKPRTVFSEENKAYCAPCRYCGSFTEGYLCDYNVLTGKARGCKPGVGCEKRETDGKTKVRYGKRVCERCGSEYVGSENAHFCATCRNELWHQEAKKKWGTWG